MDSATIFRRIALAMASRTFARSSASRDQASSPPSKIGPRIPAQSQSPAMRSTRSTRSRSRDIHDNEELAVQISTRSRRARQGSVESIGSVVSAASADVPGQAKGKGRLKNTRGAFVAPAGLSVLNVVDSRYFTMLILPSRLISGCRNSRI